MRSKNAFKNLLASLCCELIIFVFGLIVPRLIILSYGDAVNGLTQTINRLLSLINLIQAGAVGAAIYQMYKPVADQDYETQSSIIYSSKRYYQKLGVIYFVLAIVVAFAYAFGLQSNEIEFFEILFSFLVLSVNGSLYFFFTSKYDVVFSSYQKRYLLTISNLVERIVYYTLLFVVALCGVHFIFMYVAMLFGGLIRVAINTYFYKKLTAGKISKNPQNKKFEIKDRKFLMMNSIGTEMITAAPTVIITTFVGLEYSSVFSVYAMIYTSMKTIINSVQLSVSAIFGNLVAKSNDKKISAIFNLLLYVFIIMGAFLASCTAFLLTPFLDIYTDGFDGINYKYPILVVFVFAYVVLFAIRMVFAFVSTVYGLFKDMCKFTLILGTISILISLLCTVLFGMPYVMIGVLLFHFTYTVALIVAYKKKISWFSLKKLAPRVIFIIALPAISYLLYTVNPIVINSFFEWVLVAVIYASVVALILIFYSFIFERNEMRSLYKYVKQMLKRKKIKS